MRIFYPLPTLLRNGGIKVCIQHSHLFNTHGIDAYIVVPSLTENPYPRYTAARFIENSDCLKTVVPDDIFIFCWTPSIRPFFHLNNRFIFYSQSAANQNDPGSPKIWMNDRFELCTISQHSRNFFLYGFGKESQIIGNWIDTEIFYPGDGRVVRRVGMMNHRSYRDINLDKALHDAGFAISVIEGTEVEVAESMRSCDYFLSCSAGVFNGWDQSEGFALPSAEAMACGALIVSYNNHGCLEYLMDRINGRVSLLNTPGSLMRALNELDVDPTKERKRDCGVQTICERFNRTLIWQQLKTAIGI